VSVGKTAELIGQVMGVDIEILTDNARFRPADSEVERLWADNAKARELFGWFPEYGGEDGLRRGLTKTAEWFSDMNNIRRYKTNIYNI